MFVALSMHINLDAGTDKKIFSISYFHEGNQIRNKKEKRGIHLWSLTTAFGFGPDLLCNVQEYTLTALISGGGN